MLINIIVWIVFGALAGWIASMIAGTNASQGPTANVFIGILGAIIGGMISRALGGPPVTEFNLSSLIVAVIGAVLLLFILRLFRRSSV